MGRCAAVDLNLAVRVPQCSGSGAAGSGGSASSGSRWVCLCGITPQPKWRSLIQVSPLNGSPGGGVGAVGRACHSGSSTNGAAAAAAAQAAGRQLRGAAVPSIPASSFSGLHDHPAMAQRAPDGKFVVLAADRCAVSMAMTAQHHSGVLASAAMVTAAHSCPPPACHWLVGGASTSAPHSTLRRQLDAST